MWRAAGAGVFFLLLAGGAQLASCEIPGRPQMNHLPHAGRKINLFPKLPDFDLTDGNLTGLATLMDGNGNGRISTQEVSAFVSNTSKRHLWKQTIKEIDRIDRIPKVGHQSMDDERDQRLMWLEFLAVLNDTKAHDYSEIEKTLIRNIFEELDADSDNTLEMEEAVEFVAFLGSFLRLDRNSDGFMTFQDFLEGSLGADVKIDATVKSERKSIFKALDKNEDKKLSPKEYILWVSGEFADAPFAKRLVKKADKNQDGMTAKELIKYKNKRVDPGSYEEFQMKRWAFIHELWNYNDEKFPGDYLLDRPGGIWGDNKDKLEL